MKVYAVMDGDYDGDWIVAVYATEVEAQRHANDLGMRVVEESVLDRYEPDAAAIQRYHEARTEASRQNVAYLEHEARQAKALKEARPRPPFMGLCHCQTFTTPRWTMHGYCSYCGGWAPEVFKQYMGDEALRSAIADLAVHDRERMTKIVGGS